MTTLSPKAVEAAARAMSRREYPEMDEAWHEGVLPDYIKEADPIITAYLASLPLLDEGLVADLLTIGQNVPWGMQVGSVTVNSTALKAADTITRLCAELGEVRK